MDALAVTYDQVAGRWGALCDALLPASIPALAETRALLDRRRACFHDRGAEARAELVEIDARLAAIEAAAAEDPMSADDADALYQTIATAVRAVHLAESEATAALERLADAA
ncbi:hypothetical protein [Haliangium sp.]|uniref:hypothetical protein n=1 Tax=Haliangium sp. TaxID=2663208 RepID=UPI003D0FC2A4